MSDVIAVSASVPVVVLAGGQASVEMEAATGATSRALIEFGDRPLLLRVVEALMDSEPCGPITVVGKMPPSDYYSRLPDKGDFVTNLFSGAIANEDAPFILICTSDLPFLTAEAVTDFVNGAVEKARQTGASLIYPIVPVSRCYARFPGMKRTALKLKEDRFTGGNLMIARPQFLISQRERISDAYRARKSPLRLANILGWDMLFRLFASQTLAPRLLDLPMLESRVSQLINGPARVFVSGFPEIATDLDRPSEVELVRNFLRRLDAGEELAALPEMDALPVPAAPVRKKPVRKAAKKAAAKSPAKGKPGVRKRTP